MQPIENFLQAFMTEWPDLLWLPVAALIVHKGQKLKALFFVIVCISSLRLQMEIMQSTGFTRGFTGFFQISSFQRGLIVYSVFIAGYILISYLSPYTKGPIYLAASLSIFFMAFVASFFMMMV
jgi:hypothetical protein